MTVFSPYGATSIVAVTATSQNFALPSFPAAGTKAIRLITLQSGQTQWYIRLGNGATTVSTTTGVYYNSGTLGTELILGIPNGETHIAIMCQGTPGSVAITSGTLPEAGGETTPYAEGTWTPTITFATPGDLSVTYSAQRGWYRKIGTQVTVGFAVATSAFTHTTASGNLRIPGLPFAAGTIDAYGPCAFQGITKANYTQFSPQGQSGQTYLVIAASGSGQSLVNVMAADTPTGGTLIIASTTTYYQ